MTPPPGAAAQPEDEEAQAYYKAEDAYKSACEGEHITGDEYAAFEAGWDAAMTFGATRVAEARRLALEEAGGYIAREVAEHRACCFGGPCEICVRLEFAMTSIRALGRAPGRGHGGEEVTDAAGAQRVEEIRQRRSNPLAADPRSWPMEDVTILLTEHDALLARLRAVEAQHIEQGELYAEARDACGKAVLEIARLEAETRRLREAIDLAKRTADAFRPSR